ncbi:hypothetical protein NL676_028891 [Syzygium grande]|nr:hypothetical protein NL676_028891 [Syzygium grande]
MIADIQDAKGCNLTASIGSHWCTYIHCDITDEQQASEVLGGITLQSNGRLHILFSNAGTMINIKQDILNFDIQAYESLFAVNVPGMAACSKQGARAMVAGAIKGSIICIGSVAASTGTESYIDYTMSCRNTVTVSSVGVSEEEGERMYESSSCLKGVMKAKHVADAVVFLASEEAEFINGHNLAVNGGWAG